MAKYYTTLTGKKIPIHRPGWNLTRQHYDEVTKKRKIEEDIRKIIDKLKERPRVIERDPTSGKLISKELKIDCPPVLISEIRQYIYQNFDEKK